MSFLRLPVNMNGSQHPTPFYHKFVFRKMTLAVKHPYYDMKGYLNTVRYVKTNIRMNTWKSQKSLRTRKYLLD